MSFEELALLALETIGGIIKAVRTAQSGQITAEDARVEIVKLMAELGAADTAADKALEKRFALPEDPTP